MIVIKERLGLGPYGRGFGFRKRFRKRFIYDEFKEKRYVKSTKDEQTLESKLKELENEKNILKKIENAETKKM